MGHGTARTRLLWKGNCSRCCDGKRGLKIGVNILRRFDDVSRVVHPLLKERVLRRSALAFLATDASARRKSGRAKWDEISFDGAFWKSLAEAHEGQSRHIWVPRQGLHFGKLAERDAEVQGTPR